MASVGASRAVFKEHTMNDATTMTVGQFVAEHPAAASVLERHGIDYCCGGNRMLVDACRERQISLVDLQRQVADVEATVEQRDAAEMVSWAERSLTELCEHIEQQHHAYLRVTLPRLEALMQRVVEAHAARHPELYEVQRTLASLRGELEMHMVKEERVLFPAIRALERSGGGLDFPFGSVANPISVMEAEHQDAATALQRLYELTSGYQVPEDGCSAYSALLSGLKELSADLRRHIHEENNILFPRALRIEQGVR